MASAFNDHWKDVETRLDGNWFRCDIAWPGVDFDTDGRQHYLRPTPLWGNGELLTFTTNGWNRVVGIYDLDLFERHGEGYGRLREWADELRDLFDRATVGLVEFRAASAPQIIPSDSGWIGVKVSVPFTIDEQS